MPEYCSVDKAEAFTSANRDGACVGLRGQWQRPSINAILQEKINSLEVAESYRQLNPSNSLKMVAAVWLAGLPL